jgi:membrane protein
VQRVSRLGTRTKLEVERARARYGVVDIAIGTFKRYSQDDCGFYAASLTYFLFFSIFPMLLFATAVLGFFLDAERRQELIERGVDSVPMLGQILTKDTLLAIENNAGTLALISILLALYTGSGGVTALMHALNRVHHVEHEPNFVGKRLLSLKWLGFMTLAAMATLIPSGLAEWASSREGVAFELLGFGGHALAVAVAVGVFAVTFKFLPNKDLTWADVLPGAVIAAIAFEVLKLAGSFYLKNGAEGRNATFGAFATAAALLVVSYLLAQVVLLAAELNAVLVERRETRQSNPNHIPSEAVPQAEDKEGP